MQGVERVRGGFRSARARLVPLVLMSSLAAAFVGVRIKGFGAKPHARGIAGPAAAPPSASASASPDSSGLGAPAPVPSSRVAEHTTRMLHEDAHRTHRARGRIPLAAKVAWQAKTAGGMEAQITTSPDEQTLYVASLDGTVSAFARDGTKTWTLSLGDRVYSSPCVADDGTIYIGTDAKSFAAIAPEGRVKWRLETDADADTGAVIAKDGNIVFAAGTFVYSVRPGGDVAWRFHAKRKIFTAPAIADDGTVYVGSQDHHAYAIKPNGQLAWSVDLGADVDGAPAIGDDGAIFFGDDDDEIVRLGATGDIAWRTKTGGFVRGALSIARNGDVLAGVYGPSPREVRVSPDDGAIRGAFPIRGTGARELGVHGGALEDDTGALAFGAQDDAVYALEPSGAIRWKFPTEGDVDAPVTLLSDGSLVFASDEGDGADGRVYFLSP